jgi:hypothetical protein
LSLLEGVLAKFGEPRAFVEERGLAVTAAQRVRTDRREMIRIPVNRKVLKTDDENDQMMSMMQSLLRTEDWYDEGLLMDRRTEDFQALE